MCFILWFKELILVVVTHLTRISLRGRTSDLVLELRARSQTVALHSPVEGWKLMYIAWIPIPGQA